MTFASLILAVGVPTLIGYLAAHRCLAETEGTSRLEELVLGWGLGMGFVTLVLFALGAAGIPFTLGRVLLPAGLAALALAVPRRPSGAVVPKAGDSAGLFHGFASLSRPAKASVVGLGAWLALKGAVTLAEAWLLPIYSWDSWVQWSSGGKFFFVRRGLVLDPADPHFFGWDAGRVHLNYPLHVSLSEVWFALCRGDFNEIFVKAWGPLTYFAIVALLYSTLRRETSVPVSLLFSLLLASAPLLTFHAFDAYADLTLAFHELAAMACFWRVAGDRQAGDRVDRGALFLSGTFAALAIWTKQEGLLFAIVLLAVASVYLLVKRRLKALAPALFVPPALLCTAWFGFLRFEGLPVFGRGEQIQVSLWHWEILPTVLRELLLSANFNVVFGVFLVISAWSIGTIARSELKYPYLVLAGTAGSLVFVYLTTENYRWVQDPALSR